MRCAPLGRMHVKIIDFMVRESDHIEPYCSDGSGADAITSRCGGDSVSGRARLARLPVAAWLVVLLVAWGIVIYSNVLLRGIFIFDDFDYVVENPIVKDLARAIAMSDPRQVGYLSFAMNYAINPSWDPFGFHLVNVIIHIVTSAMIFFLLKTVIAVLWQDAGGNDLSEGPPADLPGDFVPALAALVFLVHPLQTQAVSYITQRFTSLSVLLYVMTVLTYLRARLRFERGEQGSMVALLYVVSFVSAVLAMKTKEISFTIPFMLAALELLLFRRSVFGLRRAYFLVPFMATLMVVPLSLLGPDWGIMPGGAGVDEVTRRDKLFDLFQRSPYEYFITQLRVVVTYMRLMVLPVNQMAVYDFRPSRSFFEPGVILSLLFLLSVAGSAVYAWRRSAASGQRDSVALRLYALGVLWFFVTLSVESSVIPIKDLIFEHRAYLPSIGAFAALAVLGEWGARRFFPSVVPRIRMAALAAALIIPLSVATYMRNEVWTDEVLFWDDVLRKTGKAIGYNNRGNAYLKIGRYDLAVQDLTRTIAFFPSARDSMAWENSDFTPTNMAKTYMSRGNAYAALGDIDKANADFKMARYLMVPAGPPVHQDQGGAQ